MGETPKPGRFEPRRSLRLALIPAVGLAVVAFTTPAHAEGATTVSVVPASLSIPAPGTAPDAVPVTQPEPAAVQTGISSVVASVLVEPTGDGSAVDPVAASGVAPVEAPGEVPTSVESPANQPAPAPPEDVPQGSPDTSNDVVVPTPPQDGVDPATTAVISGAPPANAAPVATGVAPQAETAGDPVEIRPTRQYQSTPKQYQRRRTVDDQPSEERSAASHLPAKPTGRDGKVHVVRNASKSVQILSLICADIGSQNPVLSAGDEAPKSDWNIKQIGGCIVDLSGSEDLPEDVPTATQCESASQYQPQSGQYQTAPCEPGAGESADASSTTPSDCLPPDVGESIDQVAPIEIVIGDSYPFDASTDREADASTSRVTCAASPPVGTATAPAVANPQGRAGAGVETATGTATPASAVSQPVETPTAARAIEAGKPAGRGPVARSTTVNRSSVPAWIKTATPLPAARPSVRAKPHAVGRKHRASPRTNRERSTPRSRFEALRAQRSEPSPSSGALTFGGSAWLAAAALLLLFALGSFGMAIAGLPGPAMPALLRHLRSRVTSKGLSRHSVDGMDAKGHRGIRYRD